MIRDVIDKHGPALPPRRSPCRPNSATESSRYMPGGHFPMEVPPTEKKNNPTRKCVVCSVKRDQRGKPVRKESRYMCKVCQIALCFMLFWLRILPEYYFLAQAFAKLHGKRRQGKFI